MTRDWLTRLGRQQYRDQLARGDVIDPYWIGILLDELDAIDNAFPKFPGIEGSDNLPVLVDGISKTNGFQAEHIDKLQNLLCRFVAASPDSPLMTEARTYLAATIKFPLDAYITGVLMREEEKKQP